MLHDGRAIRVAVVGGSRIPFCRSHSLYRHYSNQDLMTAALDGLINRFDLKGQTLGDVALGAVVKHSRDFNLARESVIESGLSMQTPAVDLQRACGTSIEAAIMIANKIALGQIESGIAGGTDTVSDAPIVYNDDYRRNTRQWNGLNRCFASGQGFSNRSSRAYRNHARACRWAKAPK
jgi:acetyl-CoA C-acetyltransferase